MSKPLSRIGLACCVLTAALPSSVAGATKSGARENIVFPEDAGLVDVTEAPYRMTGDGTTDNTAALRRAFVELRGSNRTLYFPNGTYLLSNRVNISGDEPSRPHSPHRFLHIQGQSEAGVVLKLEDNAPGFGDPARPKTFLSLYQGASTGDVMHSYVRNITVDVGTGNPGAAALRFMTNNSGAMYDVTIRSSDPEKRGAIGLDLRQSQNGPGLIKRVTVDGFDYGIQTGNTFSLVFEHITVRNQRTIGFHNHTARTTLRGLTSENTVPALVNDKHGQLTLIGANLSGGASEAAIVNEVPKIFVRDVRASGYAHTVKASDGRFVDGPIDEWFEGKGHALFGAEPRTLRLPIEETPEVPWETDLSRWVKAEPGNDGLATAIDRAAREGKTTVYLPKLDKRQGKYVVTGPVRVHGSVNRIIGMESILWIDEKIPPGGVAITFAEDLRGPVVVERFFNALKHRGWKGLYDRYLFENRSPHPVVIRNFAHGACMHKKPAPGGTWFIEDMAGGRKALFGPGEKCWARQYNPESPDLNLCEVDGGQVWILGMKTEGRARHIIARNGAKVELLGGVSYQSWKKQKLDPPMFTVADSEASFTFGFYHWNQPFTTIVEETHGDVTRTLARKELEKYHMPVYRAGR
jgi:hypothetical protein